MNKYKRFVYNFYKKNTDNFIGKTFRLLRAKLYALRQQNFNGTKDDLRYVESSKGAFDKTKRIAFELSNICNYATIHAKCPLNCAGEKKILSENIVYKVLESLKTNDYRGYIAFDVYNEPCIDPRLMMFIKKTREMLPKAKIAIQSNGFYFDQTLAEELEKNGVGIIRVSSYNPLGFERLSKIKLNIPFKVTPIILDDRMKIYELPENGSTRPCLAPLNEVLVTHDCKLALCCWDWKRQNVFGDLNTQSIEEILLSDEVRDLYNSLSKGERRLDICKRCPHCR